MSGSGLRRGGPAAGWPGRPLEAAGADAPGAFLGVQAPLEESRFVVLPVPYERTTTFLRGTARGPAAFIAGSLSLELFDEELACRTYRAGIHTLKPFPCAGPPAEVLRRLRRRVEGLARLSGKTLFCVGGEHSISHATIAAFAAVHPGLSVLHFDAHADLRPEYEGDPLSHACALHPASRSLPVVQVGVRSVGEEEAHLAGRGRVRTHLLAGRPDIPALAAGVLRELTGTVYLSLDLDGFDPSVIPGVGTPQPGGFSWHEGLDLLRRVAAARRVAGVELVELSPRRGCAASETAAAKLAYRLMGWLLRRDAAARTARGRGPAADSMRAA